MENKDNNQDIPHFWSRSLEFKNSTSPDFQNLNFSYQEKPKKSFFFKFFIFSLICLFLTSLYVFYQFYSKRNAVSSEKIILDYDLDLNAVSGKSKNLRFAIINQNSQKLINSKLILNYERGRSPSGEIDSVTKVFEIGDLLPNNMISTSTEVIFFGQEGDIKKIKLIFVYQVLGSNASFNKEINLDLKISAPLITLEVLGPNKVIRDNDFVIQAKIKNIAQNDFVPSIITFDLPYGFKIIKEKDEIVSNKFELMDLKLGEEKIFKLRGKFENVVNELKIFKVYVGAQSEQNKEGIKYASANLEVNVIDYPIVVNQQLKSLSKVLDKVSKNTEYTTEIFIKNVSQNAIDDVVVRLTKNSQTRVFDKQTNSDLARILPGQEVSIFVGEMKDNNSYENKIEVLGKEKGSFDFVLLKEELFKVIVE